MKRWICILLAAVILVTAIPPLNCMASQDVWSAFLPTDCTDTDQLSSFFKQQLTDMKAEWKSERKETAQNGELLSRRVNNATLNARADMLLSEIDDLNGRISDNEAETARVGALLPVGSATRSDLDALEDEKAQLEKDLENAQKDLKKTQSDQADLEEKYREGDPDWDIYRLDTDTDFWNGGLEYLTDYALSHDADYCDAVTQEQEALWTLWMDYTLRQAQGQEVPDEFFGLDIASGDKVDEDDLRKSYDDFLVSIGVMEPPEDEAAKETSGEISEGADAQSGFILPFPGDEDESDESSEPEPPEVYVEEPVSGEGGPGTVIERPEVSTEAPGASYEASDAEDAEEDEEEEPDDDSLYNALLDYQEKAGARMKMEDSLTDDIEKAYDDLSDSWDEYVVLAEKSGVPQEVALKLNRVSYRVGEKTKEDYEEVIEEYKTLKTDLAQAQYEYVCSLYETDLLTGGGMSFLNDNPEIAEQPEENEEEEDEEAEDETSTVSVVAYTKDEPLANTFTFGVVIPKKMESEITHFELWGATGRIGEPTRTSLTLFSPTLEVSQLNGMKLYFLRDGEYVGECEIDPYVPMGQITAEIRLKKAEEK